MSSLINNHYINALDSEFSPEVKALSRALDNGAEAFDLVWLAFVGMYIMQSKQIESQVEDLEEKLKTIEKLQELKRAIKKGGETEETLFSELEGDSVIVDVEDGPAGPDQKPLYKDYILTNGYKLRQWLQDDPSTAFFNELTGQRFIPNTAANDGFGTNDADRDLLKGLDWSKADSETNTVYRFKGKDDDKWVFAIGADEAEARTNAGSTNITDDAGVEVGLVDGTHALEKEVTHFQILDRNNQVVLSIFDYKNGDILLMKPGVVDPESEEDDFTMYLTSEIDSELDLAIDLGNGVTMVLDMEIGTKGAYINGFAIVDEALNYGAEFSYNKKSGSFDVEDSALAFYLEEKYFPMVDGVYEQGEINSPDRSYEVRSNNIINQWGSFIDDYFANVIDLFNEHLVGHLGAGYEFKLQIYESVDDARNTENATVGWFNHQDIQTKFGKDWEFTKAVIQGFEHGTIGPTGSGDNSVNGTMFNNFRIGIFKNNNERIQNDIVGGYSQQLGGFTSNFRDRLMFAEEYNVDTAFEVNETHGRFAERWDDEDNSARMRRSLETFYTDSADGKYFDRAHWEKKGLDIKTKYYGGVTEYKNTSVVHDIEIQMNETRYTEWRALIEEFFELIYEVYGQKFGGDLDMEGFSLVIGNENFTKDQLIDLFTLGGNSDTREKVIETFTTADDLAYVQIKHNNNDIPDMMVSTFENSGDALGSFMTTDAKWKKFPAKANTIEENHNNNNNNLEGPGYSPEEELNDVSTSEFYKAPRSVKDTEAFAESEEYLIDFGIIDTDGDGEYFDDFQKYLQEELGVELESEHGVLTEESITSLTDSIDGRIETLTSLNQIDMLYLQRNFNNLNLIVTALSNIESSKHRADNVVANNMG